MNSKIKQILKEKGITQKELAAKIGMSEVGLSKAINGSTSKDTIAKIASAIDVDCTELFDENMLIAKYGSDKTPLILGDIQLPCYVLENGMRVFSGRGMQNAIGVNPNSSGTWLGKFINSDVISSNLDPGILEKLNNPIPFTRTTSSGSQSGTNGYEVTLLIDLCDAIIRAYETRHDSVSEIYYKSASVILRAVAKVGIIALVDEATGYNKAKERARDELQKFLDKFLSEEAAKWVKVFDDTFFEDLYKMHNWSWSKTTKRPGVVGRWINDIVYDRIAPLIRTELEKLNPKNERGNRSNKHHQYLTRDAGLPKLKQHLEAVHALAVISGYRWNVFMKNMDKAYPKQYQQLEIDFYFDLDD